jgi:hypothetical protein
MSAIRRVPPAKWAAGCSRRWASSPATQMEGLYNQLANRQSARARRSVCNDGTIKAVGGAVTMNVPASGRGISPLFAEIKCLGRGLFQQFTTTIYLVSQDGQHDRLIRRECGAQPCWNFPRRPFSSVPGCLRRRHLTCQWRSRRPSSRNSRTTKHCCRLPRSSDAYHHPHGCRVKRRAPASPDSSRRSSPRWTPSGQRARLPARIGHRASRLGTWRALW